MPIQVVQVDHTKADIFVVDEETRQPIDRPWLTLAMEAPSRLSTSLRLLHAVFDKSAWLREREITEAWPIAGLPETLHVDSRDDACVPVDLRRLRGSKGGRAIPITPTS